MSRYNWLENKHIPVVRGLSEKQLYLQILDCIDDDSEYWSSYEEALVTIVITRWISAMELKYPEYRAEHTWRHNPARQ